MSGKNSYHCDGCEADVPFQQYDEKSRRCVTCLGLDNWKGPLECPICACQKLMLSSDPNQSMTNQKFYTCDTTTCGWKVTEAYGNNLAREARVTLANQRHDSVIAERAAQLPHMGPPAILEKKVGKNTYESGACRDSQIGKGRFELNPFVLEQALSLRLEEYAPHYGRHNWRKGIPITDAMSSAKRHLSQAIEVMTRRELGTIDHYTDGMEKENHWGAALFNIGIMIQAEYDAKYKKGYKLDFTTGMEIK